MRLNGIVGDGTGVDHDGDGLALSGNGVVSTSVECGLTQLDGQVIVIGEAISEGVDELVGGNQLIAGVLGSKSVDLEVGGVIDGGGAGLAVVAGYSLALVICSGGSHELTLFAAFVRIRRILGDPSGGSGSCR